MIARGITIQVALWVCSFVFPFSMRESLKKISLPLRTHCNSNPNLCQMVYATACSLWSGEIECEGHRFRLNQQMRDRFFLKKFFFFRVVIFSPEWAPNVSTLNFFIQVLLVTLCREILFYKLIECAEAFKK